jgi:hypothetical protein
VPTAARRTLVGLSVAVTLFGLAWTGQRTHDVADFFAEVEAHQSDVVISRDNNLLREAGAAVVGRQWLIAGTNDDVRAAFDVASSAHATTVLVIQRDDQVDAPPTSCYGEESRTRRRFLPNATFTLVSYRAVNNCLPAAT